MITFTIEPHQIRRGHDVVTAHEGDRLLITVTETELGIRILSNKLQQVVKSEHEDGFVVFDLIFTKG